LRRYLTAAGNGGAIYLDGGTLSMEGVYITGSAASGGAVYVASGTVQADRVLVGEATASEAGGGMYLAGGTATLVNTTFSGNTAATTGGGLHVGDAASALLLNTTFSENTAATGGGLWAGGPGKGDFARAPGQQPVGGERGPCRAGRLGGGAQSGPQPRRGDRGVHGLWRAGGLDRHDGRPARPAPGLVSRRWSPFPEAGDLLPVYALLEDSPARDAGNTALLMDTTLLAETPGYDQRGPGYPRFQGTAVDIGAYEYALPRVVPEHHSADQNANARINLSELLRVVQLYNLAAYHCDATGEDGYAPGPGDALCPPHTSDYNPQDWRITLSELLRLIQLYNTPNYTPCPNGEDGYCLP
jgi:predicted outer membrane repeat protein